MKVLILLLVLISQSFSLQSSFRRNFNSPVDSVEVVLLKVEFQEETPDNSLTTGTGLFDSDPDTLETNYSLDPQGERKTKKYWQDHFSYVRDYFQKVSNNRLNIGLKVYPQSDDSAYTVPKHIIDYNRTQKNKEEKLAAFDSSRIVDYMSFIQDAVYSADSSSVSPFSDLAPLSSGVKRVYVILHAGASRMLDGGGLGTQGADTPGDFIDAYIDETDYVFLKDLDSLRSKDSLGIKLNHPAIDTFTSVIVMSETHSQDGLNWGTNGMMIHLLARAFGMPITYNASKGVSRLGYFDLLDFAGANSGNGFFPVYPSAWIRAYMGWEDVIEIKPGDYNSYDLHAAGDSLNANKLYKIDLGSGEYLLLENRQRTLNDEGLITLYNDKDDSVVVKVDSLNVVFQDSICDPDKDCVPNEKKASGILTKASHYDIGLPSSGVAVWHVNEWILNQTLPYGYVNSEQGEFSNDLHGLYLIEADGVKNLGVEISTGVGRSSYDYGSGIDLWPSKVIDQEWNTTLESFGSKSSQSWIGGINHLSISFEVDSTSRLEKTYSSRLGDSLVNQASRIIRFKLDWGGVRPKGGKFPIYTGSLKNDYALNVLENTVSFVDANNNLRIIDTLGNDLGIVDAVLLEEQRGDSVKMLLSDESLESYDSVFVKTFGDVSDFIDLQSNSNELIILTENYLKQTTWSESDSLLSMVDSNNITNPTRMHSTISSYVVGKDSLIFNNGSIDVLGPITGIVASSQSLDKLFLLDSNLRLFNSTDLSESSDIKKMVGFNGDLHNSDAKWTLLNSDIDRDGEINLVLYSSLGEVLAFEDGAEALDFHYKFLNKNKIHKVALGDLNNDGLVEIISVIDAGLLVLDYQGIPMPGFPYEFREQSIVTQLTDADVKSWNVSSPLVFDVNGDEFPEVVIATSAGLIHAVDYKGNLAKEINATITKNSWPLSFGNTGFEKDASLPVNLVANKRGEDVSLYAHNGKELHAFTIPLSNSQKYQWPQEGGSTGRTWFFDANSLEDVEEFKSSDKIEKFFVFPNPIKSKSASLNISIGAEVKSSTVRVFDITGSQVFKKDLGALKRGTTRLGGFNFGNLGSDTYRMILEVTFESGKKRTKWFSFAVIR